MLSPTFDGPPKFVSSNAPLFGNVPGPWWAQRFSGVLVGLIRRRIVDFELRLWKRLTKKPGSIALDARVSREVDPWIVQRGGQKATSLVCKYVIDDGSSS